MSSGAGVKVIQKYTIIMYFLSFDSDNTCATCQKLYFARKFVGMCTWWAVVPWTVFYDLIQYFLRFLILFSLFTAFHCSSVFYQLILVNLSSQAEFDKKVLVMWCHMDLIVSNNTQFFKKARKPKNYDYITRYTLTVEIDRDFTSMQTPKQQKNKKRQLTNRKLWRTMAN